MSDSDVDSQAMTPSTVLTEGTRAWYADGNGQRVLVTINGVHYDDVPPYYTILLDGVERETVRERLHPLDYGISKRVLQSSEANEDEEVWDATPVRQQPFSSDANEASSAVDAACFEDELNSQLQRLHQSSLHEIVRSQLDVEHRLSIAETALGSSCSPECSPRPAARPAHATRRGIDDGHISIRPSRSVLASLD